MKTIQSLNLFLSQWYFDYYLLRQLSGIHKINTRALGTPMYHNLTSVIVAILPFLFLYSPRSFYSSVLNKKLKSYLNKNSMNI